jgi:hypothetical protein
MAQSPLLSAAYHRRSQLKTRHEEASHTLIVSRVAFGRDAKAFRSIA